MLDGIYLERAGVPTAVVITELFRDTVRLYRELNGMPDYPYVVIEHPISNLDAAGCERVAERALSEVLKLVRADESTPVP